MPEGDTILSIAGRQRPVLVDVPIERLTTPQRRHALDRWPEKLGGARVRRIDTHGKHLFLRWDNDPPYLRRLGPDVLADELDWAAILVRLRSDDPTRPVGDALLDQRTLAGIGNLWKNESLYDCRIDPWRPLSDMPDADLERIVRTARAMMLREVRHGGRLSGGEVFEQGGKGCRRCGARILVRGQWDENRMTYWCPACQT